MRKYLFLPSIALCGVLLYMPTSGSSEQSNVSESTSPESENQLIKLTDQGVQPELLRMKKEDSIAFFLNNTDESLATIEVNFHGHTSHCSAGNLRINDDGMVRSEKPIGPKDFASTCFHEAGTYDFKVFGLKKNPQGLSGSIIVE